MKLELTFLAHFLVPHVIGNNQAGGRLANQSLLKLTGSFDEVLGRIMRETFTLMNRLSEFLVLTQHRL